jgi:two-component system nitrogen regulation response regulator GlnG
MTKGNEVWIVDDDRSIRWVLEKALGRADMEVRSFDSADAMIDALRHSRPDAVLSDIRMPGTDGIDLLRMLGEEHPDIPVIIMTAHSDLDSAVAAYDSGAFEYLPKPFDIEDAIAQVSRALRHGMQNRDDEAPESDQETPEIIGEAPAMQEVFRAIGRLARSNITVLINGESGSGKELVARALHRHSPRAAKPFIALNMAAIPRDLLESELFGHERGAFTGATERRYGRFEQANGGTLFLDEIGDMPMDLQTRLLRVLADGEYYRVGGREPVKADVRVIAATHQNLEQLVREKRFREDLFHRLNVIRIRLPALRERAEDIPLLLRYFLQVAAAELGVDVKTVQPDVEAILSRYPWPGNVRQLENTARWLTVMASGSEIHVEDLPPDVLEETAVSDAGTADSAAEGDWCPALRTWADQRLKAGGPPLLDEALPAFETVMIEAALAHTGGMKQEAAKLLGWGRNTLTRKMKDLRLSGDDDMAESA